MVEKCKCAVGIYALPEAERVTVRLPSLKALRFPYPSVRDGQADFIHASYRNIARGTTLIATAPTGTGKTVSALYPALRALGDSLVNKVFYFTPKTTAAAAARDCLCDMGKSATIRAVMLRAKESCCKNGLICRRSPSSCKNSRANRLADAVMALYRLEKTVVDYTDAERVSSELSVCPYELLLSYSEICDVIICDLNYLFDPVVYIRRYFTEGGRFAFLVDEAHNLPERAREMYSAELSTEELIAFRDNPLLSDSLRATLCKSALALEELFSPYLTDNTRREKDGTLISAAHLSEPPSELYGIVEHLSDTLDKGLLYALSARDEEAGERISVLRTLVYKVKKLSRTLSDFDFAYKLFLFGRNEQIRIKLFCIDTGAQIRRRIALGHGAVFFSATLSPADYYKSTLGADSAAELLVLPSPFAPEQLCVSIMDKISTRYSERVRTLPAVARTVAATLSAKRGNYMVFCPSFEYAEALHAEFSKKYPKIRSLLQKRNMSPSEREAFISEFEEHSPSYLVGFCVTGGVYSEGVDLVGESLIGAVIVGIGMPAVSFEREAMCEYYDERYDEGKLFAYVYPGMNRVLQAAGRVIRTENDRGVIVLIDDRFDDPVYKKIIPDLWRGMSYVGDAKDLKVILEDFWRE